MTSQHGNTHVQVLTGKTWTAPTLAGGRLYLRDHDEIVCLEVAAPRAAEAPGEKAGVETREEASDG